MRTLFTSLFALSVAAACVPPASDQEGAATAADSAAVNALREAEVAAIRTGDTTLAYMADDIELLPADEPAVRGIAAARAWIQEFLAMFAGSVTYTETEVIFGGDIAVETYAGSLILKPRAGGEPISENVKGIHVYRRDEAGTWKMIKDAWNSDAPPPSMPGMEE